MISIIIPTLNEENNIAKTLESLIGHSGVEIIVVDGGSTDRTEQITNSFAIKTLTSQASRAHQMNKGAAEAVGDTLLFLHADTLLPVDFKDHVHSVLSKKGCLAGAFKLSIDHKGLGVRVVEKTANMRSRIFQLPYGDQALFIKKDIFFMNGGFAEVGFLEDLIFVRSLQRCGKIYLAGAEVKTSGRRWKEVGVLKTTFINQIIVIAYLFGFPIPLLKKLYGVLKKR